jgi:hypothetical protein
MEETALKYQIEAITFRVVHLACSTPSSSRSQRADGRTSAAAD